MTLPALSILNILLGRSDISFRGSLYMRRWRIIHTKWFGVRVHNIVRSDIDRELHDHPFTFVSIILRGGYFEHTIDGRKTWYGPGSILVRSGDTLHKLELLTIDAFAFPLLVPAWTLVFRGRMFREWGFLTSTGWQRWSEFIDGKGRRG